MRLNRWIAGCGVLLGVACGGSTSGGNPLEPPPGDAVPAATVTVVDNSFGPSSVKVIQGGTVTWEWSPSNTMQHNVRWNSVPAGTMVPPQGPTQVTGAPFEVMFSQSGTYAFVCSLHSGMSGAVFVE